MKSSNACSTAYRFQDCFTDTFLVLLRECERRIEHCLLLLTGGLWSKVFYEEIGRGDMDA